jgi:hypothetical protein
MAHRPACVLHVLFVSKANSHTDAMAPGLALACYARNAMSAACVPNAFFVVAAAGPAGAGAASNAVRGSSQFRLYFQQICFFLNDPVGFCRDLIL